MKILLIFLILLASFQASTVYVCDSKKAYAYHVDRDCKGLKRCTHEIITISKSDAVNKYKRKPCGYCAR